MPAHVKSELNHEVGAEMMWRQKWSAFLKTLENGIHGFGITFFNVKLREIARQIAGDFMETYLRYC